MTEINIFNVVSIITRITKKATCNATLALLNIHRVTRSRSLGDVFLAYFETCILKIRKQWKNEEWNMVDDDHVC